MKKKILQYSITTVVGGLIAYWIMYSQGLFQLLGATGSSPEKTAEILFILCDAFFVPGIMLVMVGILMWIATTGLFDSLGYAARTALHLIFPTGLKERKTFYDYKVEKAEKREGSKPLYFILFVGIGFIVISVLMLIIWSSYSA